MEWTRGKCIGKGAFGTVHSAVDRATGRAFAVKSVDAKQGGAMAMACLESEIRILRRLRSPYVVAYLGDDATAASRNLHMELVPGGTAADAAKGGLGERAARRVLRRVASALQYLHDVAGVVHGDVKGRNVLLGSGIDSTKLADFGAARLVSEPAPRGPRGTPAWMAPEVARGGAPTPASDVWSLGCTAVELLTGKRPWSETGGWLEVGAMLLLIGFGGKRPEFPAAACVSDSCRDFLDKCLRRDAGERWSCEQLLRHPFLSADDACEPSPSPFPSPRAVLDWAASDSDSDASSSSESDADVEHEVMARAKGRVAELASADSPRTNCWVPALEDGPTWAADTWAPLPSLETSTNVAALVVRSPSDAAADTVADAGNGGTGGPSGAAVRDDVLATGGGDCGFCRAHGRPWCDSHSGHHKCRGGVGVAQPSWPPLAVVSSVLVSCILSRLIQSEISLKQKDRKSVV